MADAKKNMTIKMKLTTEKLIVKLILDPGLVREARRKKKNHIISKFW